MPVTFQLKKKHNQLLAIVLTGKPHGNSTFVANAISHGFSVILAKTNRAGCCKDTNGSFLVSVALARLALINTTSDNRVHVHTGCHEYLSQFYK